MSRAPFDCSRTKGLIDRLVAGGADEEDRRHASTCRSCGPVLARAVRFEVELGQSAQRLIAEDMPGGMLDPELTGQVGKVVGLRSVGFGATAGVAALAVVVFATVIGIRPVLLPGSSPTQPGLAQVDGRNGTPRPGAPLFSLGELTVALADRLDYQCGTDEALQTGVETGDASAVCTAPGDAGPFTAAVVLRASESGMVEDVTITANIVGASTPRSRDLVATALARITAEAFTGDGPAIRAANFVFSKASQLSGPAWAMGIEESGVRVDLQRQADGGYTVHLSVAT